MEIELDSIKNDEVRLFYGLYWTQRRIVREFYSQLPESQYDYRMVSSAERRADSPRESLVHLMDVQRTYLEAAQRGTLVFEKHPIAGADAMSKRELLERWEQLEHTMYNFLTSDAFEPATLVQAPWGESRAIDMLFFLRDHDILHIGWNLALMDLLDVPRLPLLSEYWGSGDAEAV